MKTLQTSILNQNNFDKQIFGSGRFKNTLMSTDFDFKKYLSETECWIHKTTLMPLSRHTSWLLGYNVFHNLSFLYKNDNNDSKRQK